MKKLTIEIQAHISGTIFEGKVNTTGPGLQPIDSGSIEQINILNANNYSQNHFISRLIEVDITQEQPNLEGFFIRLIDNEVNTIIPPKSWQ